ncbi:MAG TPA: secretin N-terminal domain-containing protein [Longimicrobiales bacterium]
MKRRLAFLPVLIGTLLARAAPAQEAADSADNPLIEVRNDSVSIRFIDVDLRLAVQSLARLMDRPVVFGNLGEYRVSLETSQPVPRAAAPGLLGGILETFGLELEENEEYYAVRNAVPEPAAPASTIPQAVQLYAIQIRHARAADVAATVSALYGQPNAMGEIGVSAPRPMPGSDTGAIPLDYTTNSSGAAPIVGRVAQLTGEVRIVPDPRTNTLLIRATPEDFELINATVQQLDIRPLQVLIEVVIAEVRRDRGFGLGVGMDMPSRPISDLDDAEWSVSTPGVGLGDLVLKMLKLGGVDLTATLEAAASRGDVTILSRPVLLAANNAPAEIHVGSQRPFVQVQRTLPTDSPTRDQVVQFKDVGTRLSVTPTVSQDGYVMLEVVQEVSAATAEVAFDAPVISTRSIRTNLLVKDGHTAVMGGLGDRQRDVSRSGIPILSSLPLLGGLFGRHSTRTTETELFVFLTPRVIRTDDDLDAASDSIGDRTRALTRN